MMSGINLSVLSKLVSRLNKLVFPSSIFYLSELVKIDWLVGKDEVAPQALIILDKTLDKTLKYHDYKMKPLQVYCTNLSLKTLSICSKMFVRSSLMEMMVLSYFARNSCYSKIK